MKIAIVSLGCPKNLVDSEFIAETLQNAGHDLVPEADDADLVIVNTCAFLGSAVEESLETMLGLIEEGHRVACAGCLVSRYGRELLGEIPELVFAAGPGSYDGLPAILNSEDPAWLPPRFDNVVSRHTCLTGASAYVKISEGCSHHCHYCMIPALRGERVDNSAAVILDECRGLLDQGVREINLVAQDLGSYGRGTTDDLCRLVERIADLDGLAWLRLLYLHPDSLTPELVRLINDHPHVCSYLDMPVQHVNERVLKNMGRRGGAAAVERALELLADTDIWLRTTLMVGHPGEDEDAFRELEAFVARGRIAHLGVFPFSAEEGTRSATLAASVSTEVAEERAERLMALQQEVSLRRLNTLVGTRVPVLLEGYHEDTDLLLRGRSQFQAPDVDGQVIINDGSAPFGSLCTVEISETLEYDLIGRIV